MPDRRKTLAENWPKYGNQEVLTDQGQKDKCDSLKLRLSQSNDQAQDLARDLILAAFAEEKTYDGVPMVKELLEEAVNVFVFPDDFVQTVTKHRAEKSAEKGAEKGAGNGAVKGAEKGLEQGLEKYMEKLGVQNQDSAPLSSTSHGVANDGKATDADEHAASDNGDGKASAASSLPAKRPPGHVNTTGHVWTNHFAVTLQPNRKLYEYEIQGLANSISTPRRKKVFQRFIQKSTCLNTQQPDYATDGLRKIIAYKDLSPWNQNTALTGFGIVEQLLVDDYARDPVTNAFNKQLVNLNLVYTRLIDLDGLRDYVNGDSEEYIETGAAQAMNILIGRGVRDNNPNGAFQIGDHRFFTPAQSKDLGSHGMGAIRGFFSSIRPGVKNVLLNVNTAASAFYRQMTVADYMRLSPKVDKKHLIGLRVRIMYDRVKQGETDLRMDSEEGRTKTITDISTKTADQITFQDKDGNSVSVWNHFRSTYPQAAVPPNSLGGKQKCVNTSSTTQGQECWFLPEQLLVLDKQMYRRTLDKLDPKLTSNMITFASQTPDKNRTAILNDGLTALALKTQQPQVLTRSGISVARDMQKVPVRLISQPVIRYKTTNDPPKFASWDTRGKLFLKNDIKLTGPIVFCRPQDLTHPDWGINYIGEFNGAFKLNGIVSLREATNNWVTIPGPQWNADTVRNMLNTPAQKQTGLFVLVLPRQDGDNRQRHAVFRQVVDQMLGKPSLVFCEERMLGSTKSANQNERPGARSLRPYVANNAMKLNVRLGNINHSVAQAHFAFLKKPNGLCDTLVLGADVIHPKSTSAEHCPSIAAVVGNVDDDFGKFLGSVRRQTPRTEIIDPKDMQSMVLQRINVWVDRHDRRKPARILYYRGGVSGTQYKDIREKEITAIRLAWQQAKGVQTGSLEITAVIVTKRHNTRFYPIQNGHETKQTHNGNCIPGTVVDEVITSPYYFDFFLQSHVPLVGSAKPTHYLALENEMKFTAAGLQDLTNAMCYLFAHSTNAVSYVAPAYYADKLCERAALYLKRFFDGDDALPKTEQGQQDLMDRDWNRGNQGVYDNPWHRNFNDKMFWM